MKIKRDEEAGPFLIAPTENEKSLQRMRAEARRRHKPTRWVKNLALINARLSKKKSN